MVTNNELAARNDALAQQSGKGWSAATATGDSEAEKNRRELSRLGARLEEVEVVHVLQYLLQQYVALLEAPEHGAWSLDEDTTVRIACAVLARTTV